MIQIKKEITTLRINSEQIKNKVENIQRYCNYPTNKETILLTFLFISVQLFNQFSINNNIEPLILNKLNSLESDIVIKKNITSKMIKGNGKKGKTSKKGGGKKKKKKKKKAKPSKKDKKTNNIKISKFVKILSNIKIGATLLLFILVSIGKVDAQVSNVGMPFVDFTDLIHNTVGIGPDPLTYKEQHELTQNWGELSNGKDTFLSGYCVSISALSAGLITIPEFKTLLINTAKVNKLKTINNKNNTVSLSTRRLARPRTLRKYQGVLDSNIFPKLSKRNLEKLQMDVYHPGSGWIPSGFSIADVSNTSIVTTKFKLVGATGSTGGIDDDTKEMINIVHNKLIEDRHLSLKNNFIQKDDVVSSVIIYPGHAMSITVLPSGALVLRNADSLHTPTTSDWLKYKPPLNVDLTDQSTLETKQVMYEWNLLNKEIIPISRRYNQFISSHDLNLKPSSEWYRRKEGSIFKTTTSGAWGTHILDSITAVIPTDTLTPFLMSHFPNLHERQLTLSGHISSPNNYSSINTNNIENHTAFYEKLKDVQCGSVSRENLWECVSNMNVGETITINQGSYNLKRNRDRLNIYEYKHIPKKTLNKIDPEINYQRQTNMKNLHRQASVTSNVKRYNPDKYNF